jgi:hypothetical protein
MEEAYRAACTQRRRAAPPHHRNLDCPAYPPLPHSALVPMRLLVALALSQLDIHRGYRRSRVSLGGRSHDAQKEKEKNWRCPRPRFRLSAHRHAAAPIAQSTASICVASSLPAANHVAAHPSPEELHTTTTTSTPHNTTSEYRSLRNLARRVKLISGQDRQDCNVTGTFLAGAYHSHLLVSSQLGRRVLPRPRSRRS